MLVFELHTRDFKVSAGWHFHFLLRISALLI